MKEGINLNVVLLTNILSPYRKKFYDQLYSEFNRIGINFTVLIMADTEPQRHWHYDKFKASYTKLLPHKTLIFRNRFMHLNFGVSKTLKELEPDIIITSGSYIFPAVWCAIKMKTKLKYKLFFWSESHLKESRSYNKLILEIRERVRRLIFSKFDGFWFAGKMSEEFIDKYSKKNKEMYFVPNLVNNLVFEEANFITEDRKKKIKTHYSIDSNKFIFICPARLIKVKGIDRFLNLYVNSKTKEKSTILIAGDGPQRKELKSLIDELNIDVRLIGHKTESEMVELYSTADCFLLPSISDANPLTSIEALWAGKIFLISEHVGNYPEVVREGLNGYVFNYSNETESIGFIDSIVTSTEEWKTKAKEISLSIARNNYDPELSVRKLVDYMIKNNK